MAKKKSRSSKPAFPASKLAGKTVTLVGNFSGHFLDKYRNYATTAGIVEIDAEQGPPDFLVVGTGRGNRPPAEAAKLQKRYPTAQALNLAGFFKLLLPAREELLQIIAAGAPHDSYRWWDAFGEMMRFSDFVLDLSGANLRGANLYGAQLGQVSLDGADLRGANLNYTHCGTLRRVNLDGANATNVYLQDVEDCSFREANLEEAWFFYGPGKNVTRCDLTAAKMMRARMTTRLGGFSHCNFQRADLSGAKMEGTTFEQADFRQADLSGILASQARFNQCDFRGAKLCRADFRHAVLPGADLRKADLRDAVLNEADLTGAQVDGADFTGAVLSGANLTGVDVSRAKNMQAPAVRTAGPKLQELAAVAANTKVFETSAEVDLGSGQYAHLQLGQNTGSRFGPFSARSDHFRGEDNAVSWVSAPTFEKAMLNLADRWPNATLRLDTVTAKGGRTLRGQKLQDLAIAAWAEVFGSPMTAEELGQQQESQQTAARQEIEQFVEKIRTEGVEAWNRIDFRLRARYTDFSGTDLSGLDLNNIEFRDKDLTGCQFQGSSLVGAELGSAKLIDADLTGADLSVAKLYSSDCRNARFDNARLHYANLEGANLSKTSLRNVDLTDANLKGVKLLGADLTGANLTGAKLSGAHHDLDTRLPAGFIPPEDMIWNGPPRPVPVGVAIGSMDFPTFLARLTPKIQPDRLRKVKAMLKAERFQLYAEVHPGELLGIVRSQSSKALVYSCRLASDGTYCCATQNFKPCGGLRGGLCKHLLVLVIGLARAGQFDPATADGWVSASRSLKPSSDLGLLSETIRRYQLAQAGTADWQPTETAPEDYTAL